MRYLVVGLESSCTRITSKLIAYNLGIIQDVEEWDAYEYIEDGENSVYHRSIPHGIEDHFIGLDFIKTFDKVIVSSRDWNCSLLSKIEKHEPDLEKATNQHKQGVEIIKSILTNDNVYVFSSETAFLLQEAYVNKFLRSIGIENPRHIVFENPNKKYLMEKKDDS